ncbi:CPA2 family monovalent cation:H+ antiporter-2 [Dysgonomonas alginatilytica]|uniref:CPA2 family monovalent cation:H+ antiporter-2 n=1 Tax=Dysgonomonas alginatilytica TaxID=1605892 RepID=A0A2V3PWH4_9BACT|nr:cation:proton antiporter [Dysgonomonas alginatilytica]PXV69266.1 CPA2 family monovalent cation:H+ antiporter-2 [Dysgonomonas alginatilytica]
MSHLPPLVSDLALILITAGIVTILFKLLKQPVVLGYIVAGFLISPHFVLFPSVADIGNISTWAEIGVIFLLFALGLEFSFKKLIDVGGTASIATLINMGSMIAIGYVIGQLMGWTQMESVFLGGMLSMSSTTIIIKAFNDMKLQKKKFANIVFGMLIVEDLAAILMMVLLSTVAGSSDIEGAGLLENVLKLVFFMMIWFVVGIYLIPTFLKKLKKHLNDETLVIIAVGLCLGMVLFADTVGFSAALGAFIMGSILAETIESKHIEHLIEPIKNLFGAVFFVSVGMMIVPSIVIEYAIPILLLTVVVLVGRVIFASLGVLASGEGLKVSIQAGFSLAQIGEFSFIIATLGMQLGVISSFIYPIIVAVSVVTTFTTPYFIKVSTPVYEALERRIPPKWEKLITGYASSNRKTVNRQNDWNVLLKKVITTVAIYFVLSLAIFFTCRELLYWPVMSYIPNLGGRIAAAIITLLLMGPFMRAIMKNNSKTEEHERLWKDSHFNKGALIALNLLRIALCVTLILMVLIPLFPRATGLLLVTSVVIAIGITFFQGFKKQTNRMEKQFLENLNDKELAEDLEGTINQQVKNDLLNKNIHLEEIEVPQNSPRIGKTLAELNFRQTTGVDIVSIIRGDLKINIPDPNEYIYPFDKLIVAGTDEELQTFMSTLEEKRLEQHTDTQYQISLTQFELEEGCSLIGKKIKDSQIREKTATMIIGIDRNDESITNISADTILEAGDILWLAGEQDKLDNFEKNINT